jgi:hypothetical protein
LMTGSIGSKAWACIVARARSHSARAVARRIQPRTVPAGRPRPGRDPPGLLGPWRWPAALGLRRPSCGRGGRVGGQNYVSRQGAQWTRRGRNQVRPAEERSDRPQAKPHGRSGPPQPGHLNRAPARSLWARVSSSTTITDGISWHRNIVTVCPSTREGAVRVGAWGLEPVESKTLKGRSGDDRPWRMPTSSLS